MATTRKKREAADDPQIPIGGHNMRRSVLKKYLDNFVENAKITLSDNPQSNKANYTWVKNHLRDIVNAVYDK